MYHSWSDFSLRVENKMQPPLTIDCEPSKKRKGFLGALLNSLHESRRLQAQRLLRQHQHLISKEHYRTPGFEPVSERPRALDTSVTNTAGTPQRTTFVKPWVIITAVCFCVLHVVGGLMLSSTNSRPTAVSAIPMHGD